MSLCMNVSTRFKCTGDLTQNWDVAIYNIIIIQWNPSINEWLPGITLKVAIERWLHALTLRERAREDQVSKTSQFK